MANHEEKVAVLGFVGTVLGIATKVFMSRRRRLTNGDDPNSEAISLIAQFTRKIEELEAQLEVMKTIIVDLEYQLARTKEELDRTKKRLEQVDTTASHPPGVAL